MKTILLSVTIFLLALQDSWAQRSAEEMLNFHKVEKYRRMKNAGKVLTIGGAIVSIVGLVIVVNTPKTQTTNGYGQTVTTIDESGIGGAISFIAGSASLAAGIPLWIVGSHSEEKYRRKLEGLSMGLKINYQHAGLTLRCRFGKNW